MSLLPKLQQIHDPMPMSLGKAIAREIAPKVDPIEAFNKGDHTKTFFRENVRVVEWPEIRKSGKKTITRVTLSFDKGYAVATPVAPPSVQKFKPGDRVRYLDHITCMAGIERVVSAVRENYQHGKETVTRVEFTASPYSWDRADCLELISPASETETEGWVEWKGGECPIPHAAPGKYELRFSDGDEFVSNIQIKWWDKLWSEETTSEKYWIVAYKVLA